MRFASVYTLTLGCLTVSGSTSQNQDAIRHYVSPYVLENQSIQARTNCESWRAEIPFRLQRLELARNVKLSREQKTVALQSTLNNLGLDEGALHYLQTNRYWIDGRYKTEAFTLKEAIVDCLDKMDVPGYSEVSKLHQQAIHLYTNHNICLFSRLNGDLRENSDDRVGPTNTSILGGRRTHPLDKYYQVFRAAIQTCPKFKETVYRGENAPELTDFEALKGATIPARQIMSTTKNIDVIETFKNKFFPQTRVYEIDTSNKDVYQIELLSMFPKEQEVIILPGSKLKIEERTYTKDEGTQKEYVELKCVR